MTNDSSEYPRHLAAYVRTSIGHPECSAREQMGVIRHSVEQNGLKIAKTFFDRSPEWEGDDCPERH